VIGGPVTSLQGSTRNGITSSSYGSVTGTFRFERAGVPGLVDWRTTGERVVHGFTTPVLINCPPRGSAGGTVWGTDVYTYDSSICAAAAHAGIITPAAGGMVHYIWAPGQLTYVASVRNGISSAAYNRMLPGSLRVAAPPPDAFIGPAARMQATVAIPSATQAASSPPLQSAVEKLPAASATPPPPPPAFIGPSAARQSGTATAPAAAPPQQAPYVYALDGTSPEIVARADSLYQDVGANAACRDPYDPARVSSRDYVLGLGYTMSPAAGGSAEVLYGLELLGLTITNAKQTRTTGAFAFEDAVVDARNAHLTQRGKVESIVSCATLPYAPQVQNRSIYPVVSGQAYLVRCPAGYQLVGGAFRKTAGLHPLTFAPGQDAGGIYWKFAFHVLDPGAQPSVFASAICVPEGTFTGLEVVTGQPVTLGPRASASPSLRCPGAKKMLSAGIDASASPAPHGYLASRLAPIGSGAYGRADQNGWDASLRNREVIGNPAGVQAVMSGICADTR
jgi:hypothetical protein